MYCRLIW